MTVFDFGPPPQDWCWQSLDELAQQDQWASLAAWVGWLRGRYPIADQLPACWWRHSELVEELTALWVAWLGAYVDPEAHSTAAADFHDRWLPSVLARVRRWGVQCQDEHRVRPDSVYGSPEVDEPDAFAEFIGARAGVGAMVGPTRPGDWLDQLSSTAVACMVEEGYAFALSGFAGSAVRIHHDYWLPAGDLYLRVTDLIVHRQLARDEQRLRTAVEAVRSADARADTEVTGAAVESQAHS